MATWAINRMSKEDEFEVLELKLSTATVPNLTLGLFMRITVSAKTKMMMVWNTMNAATYAKHLEFDRFPSPFIMNDGSL